MYNHYNQCHRATVHLQLNIYYYIIIIVQKYSSPFGDFMKMESKHIALFP